MTMAAGLCLGVAGVGAAALAAKLVWPDQSTVLVAMRAGPAFGIAWLLLNWRAQPRRTSLVLLGIALSSLVLFLVVGVARVVLVSDAHLRLFLLRSPLLLFACGWIGSLGAAGVMRNPLNLIDQSSGAPTRRRGTLIGLILRLWIETTSSGFLGAGIGFITGSMMDPTLGPSILQDAALISGGAVGGLLGLLVSLGIASRPACAQGYSWIVLGSLSTGLLAARTIGVGAVFLIPLVALYLGAITSAREGHARLI
jgi:hypothetical protein